MEEIKTLSFFGENGLTSTSANHIANLAKEAVRNYHEKLDSMRFYSEEIGLLTSEKTKVVKKGIDSCDLNTIPAVINYISDANSLIAFLREAIKEKERRMKEAEVYRNETAWKEHDTKYSEHLGARPSKPCYPTVEDIKQTWSVGEQEKYLSLEAKAAALGKVIHEDGSFSKARIDLTKKIYNPTVVDVDGSNTIIHSFNPSVPLEEVNEVYASLQTLYRSTQAELNGMKKRIDDEIFEKKLEIDSEYAAAKREFDRVDKELQAEQHRLEETDEAKKDELKKHIQNLKIVIPHRLQSVYDSLKSM